MFQSRIASVDVVALAGFLALCAAIGAGPGHAQPAFFETDAAASRADPGRSSRAAAPRSVRADRRVAAPVLPSSGKNSKSQPLPEAPLLLVVSLGKQRLSVYSKGKLAETTAVSTGTPDNPTPSGVFAVIDKEEQHTSNIYRGASMPFMQRLTMSGVALHSGHVTGRVESHGCVRLPHDYARHLFKMTRLGARVVVSTDDPAPVEIGSMRLLEPARIAAATKVASPLAGVAAPGANAIITASLAVDAVEPRLGAEPHSRAPADRSIDPRTGKPKGLATLQREEELRAAPVSVLVSRVEGRVYVRHMFEAVADAEITISDPGRAIGTHVYTLDEMQPDGSGQRWSAVTVQMAPRHAAAVRVLSGRDSRAARSMETARAEAASDGRTPSTAAEAIARFDLPPEIVAQIAPLLGPGASLVVTDLPPSRRIRAGFTDIIVTP